MKGFSLPFQNFSLLTISKIRVYPFEDLSLPFIDFSLLFKIQCIGTLKIVSLPFENLSLSLPFTDLSL